MTQIFMLYKNRVHIINIPKEERWNAYLYARTKLGAAVSDITPWGEVNFRDGVAVFDYRLR